MIEYNVVEQGQEEAVVIVAGYLLMGIPVVGMILLLAALFFLQAKVAGEVARQMELEDDLYVGERRNDNRRVRTRRRATYKDVR